MIDALNKYEKIPDRPEVITDLVFKYISKQASKKNLDSLENSFQDWEVWSRYSGPHRSEWCPKTKTRYEKVEEGTVDEAQAIIAADIMFYDATGQLVNPNHETLVQVAYAEVIW